MLLKPWYDIVTPQINITEGSTPETLEFAVALEKIPEKQTVEAYTNPALFFAQTYLTSTVTELASEIVWRLSGKPFDTHAIFHVAGRSGEGKSHALATLYHIAQSGADAHKWTGIQKILSAAGVSSIPYVHTAVFTGKAFDGEKGRRGKRIEPLRKTLWGELAFQLGGKDAYNLVADCDRRMLAPEPDILRDLLPSNEPCLLLFDDLAAYLQCCNKEQAEQCYRFFQNLIEYLPTLNHAAAVISWPLREEGEEPRDPSLARFEAIFTRQSMLISLASETEIPDILRRRLFHWEPEVISPEGHVNIPDDALETCLTYANETRAHRLQLPNWIPFEQAERLFTETYPFHPAVLSVFRRKWQQLPHFHHMRGMLRILALWIAGAHKSGYRKVYSDPLISLGTAPLDDLDFRTAIREAFGDDNRLNAQIFTDIAGRDAFANRLDSEASDEIKHDRLHQKTATVIFLESSGGTTSNKATEPDIRFAVSEPDVNITHVDTVLDALTDESYYLMREGKSYHFSLNPNLNKLFADRSRYIDDVRIEDRVHAEVKSVFADSTLVTFFPEETDDVPDQPTLIMAVLSPDHPRQAPETLELLDAFTRNCGDVVRTFQNAIIWIVCDENPRLYEDARSILTWQDIQAERETDPTRLQERAAFETSSLSQQLQRKIAKAQKDLREQTWQSYRHIALLNKQYQVEFIDLGRFQANKTSSLPTLILNQLRLFDYVVDTISSRFLTRNWPQEFRHGEWSTKAVLETFFTSPLFPRLLTPEILKDTIAKGASNGSLGYVSQKINEKYATLYYQKELRVAEVEISDDMFIITPESAEEYLSGLNPTLTSLTIDPLHVSLKAGENITFTAHALDENGEEIKRNVHWESTGGTIDADGAFVAGEKDGTDFEVRATAGDKQAWVKVSILSKKTEVPDQLAHQLAPPEEETPQSQPTHLTWEGRLPQEKWLEFYHAFLEPYAAEHTLNLRLQLEMTKEDGISAETLETIKDVLQKLGLPENIQKRP